MRRALAVMGRLLLFALPLALVPAVMPTGVAATCTHQVSLAVAPGTAAVGATVAVTGGCFSTDPTVGPVDVRLDASTGQRLWSGRPDSTGGFTFSFGAPNEPGYHAILAFQADPYGYQMPGTPGRAPFQILAAPVATPPAASQVPAPTAQIPVATAVPAPAAVPRPQGRASGAARSGAAAAASVPIAAPATVPVAAPVVPPVAIPAAPGVDAPSIPQALPALVPTANPAPSTVRPVTTIVPAPASPWLDRVRITAITSAAIAACLLLLAVVVGRRRRRRGTAPMPIVAWAEEVVSGIAEAPPTRTAIEEPVGEPADSPAPTVGR